MYLMQSDFVNKVLNAKIKYNTNSKGINKKVKKVNVFFM